MLMESPCAVSSRTPATSECDNLVLGRHEPFSPPAAVQTGPLQRLAQARSVSGNDCMNSRLPTLDTWNVDSQALSIQLSSHARTPPLS